MANAPYMYWVGMNTPADTSAEELSKFSDYYSHTHVPEVVKANKGFIRGSRYELCGPDPRGDFGPRWLAVYEMEDEAAAKQYMKLDAGPASERPIYTPGPSAWQQFQVWWRLIWGRLAPREGELGAGAAPYLYFVAMNVPPETDAKGLAEFNEFYTNIHVPEVVKLMRFRRGTRYELYNEFRHPAPGSPRFLAVYEGDDDALRARDERAANPGAAAGQISSGPPTWEAHDTLWRLWYRRVDSWAKP